MENRKKIPGFLIIIILLAVASILSIGLYWKERDVSDRLNIKTFPLRVGDWQGKERELTEKEYDLLGTRNLIFREYSKSVLKEKLYLFIIYSETDRSVFHPPEACLIGEGITILDRTTENVGQDKYSFVMNRLNLEKNNAKEIVLYCYKSGKLYTDNYFLQQASLALHQVFGKRVAGATIRVSMSSGRDEARTLRELKDFVKSTIAILNKIS